MSDISRTQTHLCQLQLDLLLKDAVDVRGALIATTDGFEVARAPASGGFSASKLAAMASSILALGAATTREVGLKDCRNVLVDSEDGRLLLLSIPAQPTPLVLCVYGSRSASLGYLLAIARTHVEALAARFDRA